MTTTSEQTVNGLRLYIQSILNNYRDGVFNSAQAVENSKLEIQDYLEEFTAKAQQIRDGVHELSLKADRVDEFDNRLSNKAERNHTHTSAGIIDADPLVAPGAVVKRDEEGLFEVGDPARPTNPVPRSYVDSRLSNKAGIDHEHVSSDISDRVFEIGAEGAPHKLISTGSDGQLSVLTESIVAGEHVPNKYYVDTELDKKANAVHTHTVSGVVGLEEALQGKAGYEHTHSSSEITNATPMINGNVANGGLILKTASDGQLSIITSSVTQEHHVVSKGYVDSGLEGKASSAHTHTVTQVTGLSSALDDKSNVGHTHTVDQINDLPEISSGVAGNRLVQRTNVGQINVAEVPGATSHAASKGYVDARVLGLIPGMTLWSGEQSEYDSLPDSVKNAAGFVGVIF